MFPRSNQDHSSVASWRRASGRAWWPAWVVAALLGVVLALWLALGGWTEPAERLTDEQAEARAADLGEKLKAAILNGRDADPLLAPAETLVERRPDLATSHRLLGQVRLELEQWPGAYAAFAEALRIDGDEPRLHRLAGAVAEQTADWSTARRHYETARALRPEEPELWVRLANVGIKQGRIDKARPLLEQAIARDATLHEAYALLAAVHRQNGDASAELSALEQAYNLALIEGGEPLRRYAVRLSEYLLDIDRGPAAARVLRLPEPADLFTPEVMAATRRVLLALDLPLGAAQYFEQWSRREPTNADAAAGAVDLFLLAGEPDSARAMMVVLRRINGRDPRLNAFEDRLRTLADPP